MLAGCPSEIRGERLKTFATSGNLVGVDLRSSVTAFRLQIRLPTLAVEFRSEERLAQTELSYHRGTFRWSAVESQGAETGRKSVRSPAAERQRRAIHQRRGE